MAPGPRTIAALHARRERAHRRVAAAHSGLHERGIDSRERTQQAVEDVAEEPRPERYGERRTGAFDRGAGPQSRRVLVDLDDDLVAGNADHFTQQRLRTHTHGLA